MSEAPADPLHTVLVLGGYGFFGARISAALGLPPDRAIRIDASAPDHAQPR